jgi:hypothetical protein
VQIEVIGGVGDALAEVSPTLNQNDDGVYEAWVGGVRKMPAVVDFTLRPINSLFPIAQQDAITLAYNDYLRLDIIGVTTAAVRYGDSIPSPSQSVPIVTVNQAGL